MRRTLQRSLLVLLLLPALAMAGFSTPATGQQESRCCRAKRIAYRASEDPPHERKALSRSACLLARSVGLTLPHGLVIQHQCRGRQGLRAWRGFAAKAVLL